MTTPNPTSHPTPPVRLLLVDIHSISRQSSRVLLETISGFEVVGETSEHEEALQLASTTKPDVVIISMRVMGSTGPDTTRELLRRNAGIRIVFWTLFDDPEYVQSALSAGAMAYVLKQDPALEVKIAIERVMDDQIYLSPSLNYPR